MLLGDIISIKGFFEPFSSMLHLLVAGIVLVGSVAFVRSAKSRAHRVSLAAFVFGAIAVFSLSGTYHLLDDGGTPRAVMQRLDHAAIFMMIAGTFTAVHGVAFRGRWRWLFLTTVWVIAITSLTLKTVFFESLPEWGGLALYLSLGWLGALSMVALLRAHGWRAAHLMLGGGLVYSLGAAYDFAHGPALIPGVVGSHEVFHIAVVGGAFLHWRCIRRLVAQPRAAQSAASIRPCSRPSARDSLSSFAVSSPAQA